MDGSFRCNFAHMEEQLLQIVVGETIFSQLYYITPEYTYHFHVGTIQKYDCAQIWRRRDIFVPNSSTSLISIFFDIAIEGFREVDQYRLWSRISDRSVIDKTRQCDSPDPDNNGYPIKTQISNSCSISPLVRVTKTRGGDKNSSKLVYFPSPSADDQRGNK